MKKNIFSVSRHSWVSLFVCWLIWIVMAYDKEVFFRLGPIISKEFNLSPQGWGGLVAFVTLSLALFGLPGSVLSDKYGSGWKRAAFQLPLVLGYTFISLLSGIKFLTSKFIYFVAFRFFVSVGEGWSEPVGVSNTAEWWPKEYRGFALGAHHAGYPLGALLSGVIASVIISAFGPEHWRYVFFIGFVVAIPLMIFWAKYSTEHRYKEFIITTIESGLTPPEDILLRDKVSSGKGVLLETLKTPAIIFTAASTMITHVVYIGISTIFPAYLYNVMGYDFAKSAGLSAVFTITGMLGQILWPSLSDKIGRKITLIICGIWMAVSIASFYFARTETLIIVLQLFFGLVANAIWPIFYAMASDYAKPGAISTANGVITTALFIGGGSAPLIMGWLINLSGGWSNPAGYINCFFVMGVCALIGVFFQCLIKPTKSHLLNADASFK